MRSLCFIILFLSWICSSFSVISPVYLTSSCSSLSFDISDDQVTHRLQSSTALVYSNGMNCQYIVNVPNGYFVVAVFRRFELEPKDSGGTCLDYVNFYEGSGISGTLINSQPYCDNDNPNNATSAGRTITIQFVTDSSAQYRGFDLLLSAATNVPCRSDQFACNSSICIDSSLRCDGYNQCGDNSDELSCTAAELGASASDNTALIAGLTIGLGSLVIIATIIAIYVYRQYRWKKFLKDPLPEVQKWDNSDTYPVTRKYYKKEYRNVGYASIESRVPSRMSNDFDTEDELEAMDPSGRSNASLTSSTKADMK